MNREKIDDEFLKRQVEPMRPYGFDVFVIDMGWYAREGKWTPHPDKFKPGELESLLRSVKAKGTQVGLWTSPQFVRLTRGETASGVDETAVESGI